MPVDGHAVHCLLNLQTFSDVSTDFAANGHELLQKSRGLRKYSAIRPCPILSAQPLRTYVTRGFGFRRYTFWYIAGIC